MFGEQIMKGGFGAERQSHDTSFSPAKERNGRKKKRRLERRKRKLAPLNVQAQSDRNNRKTLVGAIVTSGMPPSKGPLMHSRGCIHALSQPFISQVPQMLLCALHGPYPRHLSLTCSQWPHLIFQKTQKPLDRDSLKFWPPKIYIILYSTYAPTSPQVIKRVLIPHLGNLFSSLLWNLTYQFSVYFFY